MALLCIGPWLLLLTYDMLLYIVRATYYEIPYVGGRAQGKGKPAKPTLEQRPDGRRRKFSITGQASDNEDDEYHHVDGGRPDHNGDGARRRRTPKVSFEDGGDADGDGWEAAVDD